MQYELRILSGLHRGATLPLAEHALTIGAGEQADVVLVDPGILEHHATLSKTEGGWLLSAAEGRLYAADGRDPQSVVDLGPGDFARLDRVWLTVAAADAHWEEPPEVVPFDALADGLAAAVPAQAAEQAAGQGAGPEKKRGFRARRMLFVPIALGAVLSAAAAYALSSKSGSANGARNLDVAAEIGSRSGHPGAKTIPYSMAGADEKQAKTNAAPALTPEELRKAFRKRLADADLLKRLELTLDDQAWNMHGDLDDDESARFERVLKGFLDEHRITFPVRAKVVSAEGMLPFKIRQVVSGSKASIVTQDGERLFVGDEYLGVQVVAIQASHLSFAGKRKIEVHW